MCVIYRICVICVRCIEYVGCMWHVVWCVCGVLCGGVCVVCCGVVYVYDVLDVCSMCGVWGVTYKVCVVYGVYMWCGAVYV